MQTKTTSPNRERNTATLLEHNAALVVDKSIDVRRYLSSVLHRHFGCEQVLQAESADKALALIRERHFDWIFYDWDLSDVAYEDFIADLRSGSSNRNAALIMMTRNREREAIDRALHSGVTDYLIKPFTLSILLLKLRRSAALHERRADERLMLDSETPVKVRFDGGRSGTARLVAISRNGCLTRADRTLCKGAQIYDSAALSLPIGDDELFLNAELVRLQSDRIDAGSREHVLIAFHFKPLTAEVSSRLEVFLDSYDVPLPDSW